MVKTCPFGNSTKPRPDRSRVSGLRAEKIGDLILPDHGSTKIGDKTFGFLIIHLRQRSLMIMMFLLDLVDLRHLVDLMSRQVRLAYHQDGLQLHHLLVVEIEWEPEIHRVCDCIRDLHLIPIPVSDGENDDDQPPQKREAKSKSTV